MTEDDVTRCSSKLEKEKSYNILKKKEISLSYLFGVRKKRKVWLRYVQEEYVELANPSLSAAKKLKSEMIPTSQIINKIVSS